MSASQTNSGSLIAIYLDRRSLEEVTEKYPN